MTLKSIQFAIIRNDASITLPRSVHRETSFGSQLRWFALPGCRVALSWPEPAVTTRHRPGYIALT